MKYLLSVLLSLVLGACGEDLFELPDGSQELRVYIGGEQHNFHRKRQVLQQPLRTLSLRGVPTEITRQTADHFLNHPDELPFFPKILVVVTTQELLQQSTVLGEYLDWRRAAGFTVYVGTERDWDRGVNRDGNDRQARIRHWLKEMYLEKSAGYVLLIGDPTPQLPSIPMRVTQPLANVIFDPDDSLANVGTDFYYADLNSDWDCDRDGTFAEFPDDSGPGCMDWAPELIVGRIPVYRGAAELDRKLRYLLNFERRQDRSFLNRAVFAGAFFGFRGQSTPSGAIYDETDDMAVFLNHTAQDLPPRKGLTKVRLFEDEGLITSQYPHELPLTNTNVVEQLALGTGTFTWGGHGWSLSAHRQVWREDSNDNQVAEDSEVDSPHFIISHDASQLLDSPGAVVVMVSCLNGYPEEESNLGAQLLGAGAVATISASRSAIGVFGEDWQPRSELASASTIGYYVTQMVQRGVPVGEAVAFSKWALPGDGWDEYEGEDSSVMDGLGWLGKLEFNLYGDPTLSIDRCYTNSDCDDGLPCNGTELCQDGVCIHRDPVICPDYNSDDPCWKKGCDNSTGQCTRTPVDGNPCDDGLWCTENDVCAAGQCSGAARACPAQPGYVANCSEADRECTLFSSPEEITPPSQTCDCRGVASDSAYLWGFIGLAMLRWRKKYCGLLSARGR